MNIKALETYGLFKQTVSKPYTDQLILLQQRLLVASFFNLFLVSLLGILLRAFPLIQAFPFEYKNVLHGHSHFAFGGWVMPVLLVLLLRLFPEIAQKVAYRHWRNVAVLLLSSAYGMLFSFPVQGYGAVSIVFSTLSVLAGYYLAFVIWQVLKNLPAKTSHLFLKAGLFYLAISAVGPFATGPLIAMGKAGTPIYYNSVYFYLHFQYNGWFTFTVLALFYKMLEQQKNDRNSNGKVVLWLMNIACVPAYFLSVLWNQPPAVFYIAGGIAGFLQLTSLIFLWNEAKGFKAGNQWLQILFALPFLAFMIKNLLQFLSAFPAIAAMAFLQRNLVIAYLHLVLLGMITLFAFATVFDSFPIRITATIKKGLRFFLFSFITTELLLVSFSAGNLWGFTISYYTLQLLIFSLFFPIGLGMIVFDLHLQLKKKMVVLSHIGK
jgi:hypothetical protein